MTRKKKNRQQTAKPPRSARPAEEAPAIAAWSINDQTAAIVLGVVCLAALLARVIPAWNLIFPDVGEVRLLGVDPFYHLRHTRFAAEHFPDLMRWDIGTHYPTGQRAHTASLFDLGMAFVAFVFGLGSPSDRVISYVAVWTPVILGSLTIAFLYLLTQSVFGRVAGLAAAVVFLMYPGTSLHRTLFGFADHHVAEMALGLLTTWGVIRCLQRCEGEVTSGWRPWLPLAGYALPPALLVYTWAGGAIYLLIILVILCVVCAVETAHNPESVATARTSLRYGCLLLPMIALPGLLWPDLVMSEERFPLILLGCVVIGIAPPGYAYTARALVRRYGNPRLIAITSSSLVAGAAVIFVWQHPLANEMISFLLQTKVRTLAEHRDVSWTLYWQLLGTAGILAIAGIPLALIRSVRSVENRHGLVAVLMGVTWIGLWMSAHDYDYVPPMFVALLTGVAIDAMLRASIVRTMSKRIAATVAIIAVLVAPIWPYHSVIKPWATVAVVKEHLVANDGWFQAMEWLRNETPKPSPGINEPVEPFPESGGGYDYPADIYGVFSPWDFGNMIAALGERPPIWSQWTSRQTAEWLLCEDEEQSRQLLCPNCEGSEQIRYVVLEARTIANHWPGKVINTGRSLAEYDSRQLDWYTISEEERILRRTFGARYRAAMAVRMYVDDARDLGHYRLVYASPHESYIPYLLQYGTLLFKRMAFHIESESQREAFSQRSGIGRVGKTDDHWEYDGIITSTVKIFEHVNGARLQGTTSAGSTVEAQLQLHCGPKGDVLNYSRSTRAGEDGRFEIVVAHATTPGTGSWSCASNGPYQIMVTPDRARNVVKRVNVLVDDSHIRDGKILDLGKLN